MKNISIFSLVSEYDNAKTGGLLNTPNISLITEVGSVRCLLENTIPGNFENGYEYVDLGLPSGLKWATCNVGATSPEQAGLYFAWGETTGYTAEQINAGERLFNTPTYEAGPANSISADLTLEQDAAHVNMGGNWRMPTKEECKELIDNCTATWTDDYNGTGVAGHIFTSNVNTNSVFLPAVGLGVTNVTHVGFEYYWSASLHSSNDNAWFIFGHKLENIKESGVRYYRRENGFSVRGVCK